MDSTAGGQKKMLGGYAAVYNTLSQDLGGFRETLRGGCFDDSLARSSNNIRLLADHDSAKVLGSRSNGSLSIWSDQTGLRFRCELPDTTVASDIHTLVARGDLSECSFAFRCLDESWDEDFDPDDRSGRISVRTVRKADVSEISIVTWPAYPRTSASVERDAFMTARNIFPSGLPVAKAVPRS